MSQVVNVKAKRAPNVLIKMYDEKNTGLSSREFRAHFVYDETRMNEP